LVRSHMNAGQDGFRDGVPNNFAASKQPLGLSECSTSWID
jgi:hypothetical protein